MFEWDEKKAAINLEKHGVSFEEPQTVFDDPYFLVYPDYVHSVGETRYVILGESSEWRALVVVYTERGNAVRIIGAREADRQEQKDYEEEKYK